MSQEMTEGQGEGKSTTTEKSDRNAITFPRSTPPQALLSELASLLKKGKAPTQDSLAELVVRHDRSRSATELVCSWCWTPDYLAELARVAPQASVDALGCALLMTAADGSPATLAHAAGLEATAEQKRSHGDTSAREAAPTAHPDERRRDAGDAPAQLGASHQPSPAHIEAMRRGASELVGRIEDQQRAAELHALSVVQGIQAEARAFADSYDRLYDELYDMLKARQPAGMKLSPDAEQRAKQQIKVVLQRLSGALASPSVSRQAQQNPELVEELARRFAAEHVAEQRGVWARQAPHQEPAADVAVVEAPRAPRRSPAPPDRPTMPPQAEAPPQGPLARLAELCGVPESDAARYAVLSTGKGLCVFNPATGSYEVEQEWPCDPGTMRRAYEQVVSAAAPSVWPVTDGEGNKLPSKDWSTLVRPAVYAYSAEPLTLYREQVGGLATPRVGLLSRRAEPVYSKLCDEWLSLMFGDTYEPAMRLLARWGDLSRPAAALVISGSRAIGKGLLATGLACWLTGRADAAPLEGARYIGSDASQFNAELLKCPLVAFDEGEGLDSRKASTAVRSRLTARVHTIEPKGEEVTQLHGCIRLYIAHNTDENPFRFGDLPPAGRAAVAERLAYVEGQDVAAEYLRELGEAGRARLVAELPAHLEWNAHQEHATPAPGHERFGGWVSSYVDELLRAGNRNAYLAALLLDVVEHHPHALAGLDRVEGVAWVKTEVLLRWWNRELECAEPHQERSLRRLYGDVPNENLLGRMLASLAEPEKEGQHPKIKMSPRLNAARPHAWRIPLASLRRVLGRDDDEGGSLLN